MTTLLKRIHSCALLAILILSGSGCGPASDEVEVTGNVTWNGSPLTHGSIVLLPTDPHMTPAGGKIVDGRFKLKCKPSKMRVEIESVRDTSKLDPDTKTPIGEMFIPTRYNKQSELTMEPTKSGDNHFDFTLNE